MKKKLLSLMLAVAMVAVLLVGCGAKEEAPAEEPVATEEETPVVNDGVGGTAYQNPLQDVRVRQALWYAIDMDEIVEGLWDGDVTAAEGSLIPATSSLHADGLNDYAYNPEKAKELLAEAGWDGSYTIQGVYYTENLLDTILTIQSYWKAVGINMEFEMLSDNLNELVYAPSEDGVNSQVQWDICFGGTNAPILESMYSGHYTKNEEKPGSAYLPPNEEANALLDAAINNAASAEDQKKAYDAIQMYENENVPVIPLFHISSWVINSDKLDMAGDAVGNDQYYYTKNILDWTIDREDKTMYTDGGAVSLLESPVGGTGLYLYQEFVFDRLLNANADLSPSDGNLAESYEISEDGKTITFTIREGIKWHDGVDFTAEDVAWTFEYYKTMSNIGGYFKNMLDDATITVDGNKVIFAYSKPQPNALTAFSQYHVLPKHLLEDVDAENFSTDTFWQNPVGTGPYKVDTVKLGEYTVLARNNDYYKTGTGNIEKIYMYASNDTGSANLVTNCMAGNIDYAYVKDSAQLAQIEEIDGYTAQQVDCLFTRWIAINQFEGKAEK